MSLKAWYLLLDLHTVWSDNGQEIVAPADKTTQFK
jgi:hypothetical protein